MDNYNPLSKYFRVPGMSIELPTKGVFMTSPPPNGEVDILPMRAADELFLSQPDMLLSGKAIEEMLRSCVPQIGDPGEISSPDMDVLLVAIRAATYGDEMEVEAQCPVCGSEQAFNVNLPILLQRSVPITEEDVSVRLSDEVVVRLRPYNFRDSTTISLMTFQETRKVQVLEDQEGVTDEMIQRQMNESMLAITKARVNIMGDCIREVVDPNGSVTDRVHIREFLQMIPRQWSVKIEKALDAVNQKGIDKAVEVKCPREECGHEWNTNIEFDASSFFDSSS